MIFIGIALLVSVGLALLISADAGSLVGLTQSQTAQLLPLVVLLIVFAGGLFSRRRPARELLTNLTIWVGIFLVAGLSYAYRDEIVGVAARMAGELQPGVAMVDAHQGTATFRRGMGGHFEVKATVEAGNLIAQGAIGEVINTVGLGPHAIRNNQRPDWFFERARYGGILCDIGSHQFEQFLFFSGAMDAEIVSASVANRAHPDKPGLQDVGDVHMKTERTSGYVRVDWFTPDGLPTWGDGRLTILGTEGYIELRKYVDVGQEGTDHLILVNGARCERIDASDAGLPFFARLLDDFRSRGDTAMTQAHVYKVCELALKAQARAEGKAQ